MTIAAGLPQVPAVYILDEASPNALATGRDPQHASIAVTRGPARAPRPRGTPGRRRPRDVAHPQLRHPLRDARRDPRRDDRADRRLLPALELLGRHGPPPRGQLRQRPGRGDPRDRRHRARHPRAAGRLRRAVRGVEAARVPGRRLGRRAHAQPARPGSGAHTHRLRPGAPAPRQPGDGASLHRQPAQEDQGSHRRLRHAPAHPAAHRRPAGDGPRRAGSAGGGGGAGRRRPAGAQVPGGPRAARPPRRSAQPVTPTPPPPPRRAGPPAPPG